MAIQGYAAPQVLEVYDAAHKLCQEVGTPSQYFQVLWGLFSNYNTRNRQRQSIKFAQELLDLAESTQDNALLLGAHRCLGPPLFHLGNLQQARFHLEQAISLYNIDQHKSHIYLYAHDPCVTGHGFLGFTLWTLGYPDQAVQCLVEGIALGQKIGHLLSLAYVQNAMAIVCQYRRDLAQLWNYSQPLLQMATKQDFHWFITQITIYQGWALAQQDQVVSGLEQLQAGLAVAKQIDAKWGIGYFLSLLADVYRMNGQITEGLNTIAEALSEKTRGDDRHWDAELYRLRGELLLLKTVQCASAAQEAETCFQHAIAIARKQEAKSWELRAATSLARYWQRQGRYAEARHLLQPVYAWFTEGFDTADLCAAKALLDALGDVLAAQP